MNYFLLMRYLFSISLLLCVSLAFGQMYVVSTQTNYAREFTGTYEITGSEMIGGTTYNIYTGPTEVAAPNRNLFRIRYGQTSEVVGTSTTGIWIFVDLDPTGTGSVGGAEDPFMFLPGSNTHNPDPTGLMWGGPPNYTASGSLLPVTYLSFTVYQQEESVDLNWATVLEENNEGFQVEHSNDGSAWKQIGFVPGAGTTDQEQRYTYEHRDPVVGENYYRLKQMDYDGAFEYSDIVSLKWETTVAVPTVYPNPSAGTFAVTWEEEPTADIKLQLVNVQGQVVRDYPMNTDGNNYELEFPSSTPTGNYYLLIVSDKNVQRISIQKL